MLKRCRLPLTGTRVVNRLITDRAVFDVTAQGLELIELAPGHGIDDLKASTEAAFAVSPKLREIDLGRSS